MTPSALPADRTRVEAVMSEILARIDSRRLIGGTRLPAIRPLATSLGVSKTTVVDAYQRLAAEGVVIPRQGSGFYVAEAPASPRVPLVEPVHDRAIDSYWLTFQALDPQSHTLKPGSGWLPVDWMPHRPIQKALRGMSRAPDGERVGYDTPLGFPPLRDLVSRRLAERGIDAPYERILIVDSCTQAIDIVFRLLIEPGDCVLVDDPCFFNFLALLDAHKAKIVGVPMTPDGPDLDAFADALRAHKPRLYLTNCGVHNPTGARLSPACAHRLLTLAEAHGLLIVEDDVFADLEHEPTPRLAAFDGVSRVICVGGFSKTVSSALRCGYVAAGSELIERLLTLKQAIAFGSNRLASACTHKVLTDASYRRHCDALRGKLAAATSLTLNRLSACGLTPWLEPKAGMFVWARLPEGRKAAIVARRALDAGVVLAPGEIFSRSPTAHAFMRFNVAACAEPRIFEVLKEVIG